jgi:hypothetical protein
MRRLFLLGAMFGSLVFLGGCARFQEEIDYALNAKITTKQVDIEANVFDAFEATITNYLKLPPCGTAPCRNQNAVKVLVPLVRSGRIVRNKLEAAVNSNSNGPVDANLFATLTSSNDAIQSIISEYSIPIIIK